MLPPPPPGLLVPGRRVGNLNRSTHLEYLKRVIKTSLSPLTIKYIYLFICVLYNGGRKSSVRAASKCKTINGQADET